MRNNALSMLSVITVAMTLALTGCGGGDKPKPDGGKTTKDHDHAKDEKHAHKDDKKAGAGHGGEVIALGDPVLIKQAQDQAVHTLQQLFAHNGWAVKIIWQ